MCKTKKCLKQFWENYFFGNALTGYSPEKLSRNWRFWSSTIIHPDDRAIAATQLEKFRNGQNSEIEYRLLRADGNVIWVYDSGRVEIDPISNYITVYGVITDITEHKLAEVAQQRYAERLRVLREIDYAILSAHSPQAIAHAVLRHIQHLVPCPQANVTLFNFNANETLTIAIQSNGSPQQTTGKRIPPETFQNLANLNQGQFNIVGDISTLDKPSHFHKQLLSQGIRSFISTPLISHGELIGALNLGGSIPDSFQAEHIEIIGEVANQLAIGISQARLFQAEAQRAKELAALNKAGQAITSTLRHSRKNNHPKIQVECLSIKQPQGLWECFKAVMKRFANFSRLRMFHILG